MLRKIAGALGAATLLAATLVSTGPQADAHPAYHPWGSTHADNQKLRKGCHYYPWSFKVNPPTDQWSAEIFLISPRNRPVASAAIDSASENPTGTKKWNLCYYSVVSGRYTMKMKVTYNVNRDVYDGYVKPSHFRLTSKRGR